MGASKAEGCLFCRIFKGEIPAEKIYEDEKVVGFRDIHPVAKIHLLFIHRDHTSDVNDLTERHPKNLVDIFTAIKVYTQENRLDQKGFRVVTNMGDDGGQSVYHSHFHLLAGEKLRWSK